MSEKAKKLVEDNKDKISVIEMHRLDNISDSERSNNDDYISIMENNLEIIKKEIY